MRKMKRKTTKTATKRGFTLVETSLSTALIAVLLLAVAAIVINIVSVYRKGMTLKTMNSVGRTLVEDFNSTIAASTPSEVVATTDEITSATSGTAKVFSTSYYRLYNNDQERAHGAFCTGSYSYLWQTQTGTITLRYNSESTSDFRLLKVQDSNQMICEQMTGDDVTTLDLTSASMSIDPEEMLADGDISLAVYSLTVAPVNSLTNLNQDLDTLSTEIFFTGTITLGTTTGIESEQGESENSSSLQLDSDACRTDTGAANGSGVTEFDYCAVNKFKFAARAGSADV